jgi:hypothetical protein
VDADPFLQKKKSCIIWCDKIIKICQHFVKHFYFCETLNNSTMESIQNANSEKHYKLLVVAIVIGITGVFIRFAGDENSTYFSWIANILLALGVAVGLRAVFKIID